MKNVFYFLSVIVSLLHFSVVNKSRMKTIIFCHSLLFVIWLLRMSPDILGYLGMKAPAGLGNLPRATLWEFAWLLSILPTILAQVSLPSNRAFLLKQYIIGTVIFGVLPILYGLYDFSDELLKYLNAKNKAVMIFGFPAIALAYMFMAVAAQVHLFGTYVASQLIYAWQTHTRVKKQS